MAPVQDSRARASRGAIAATRTATAIAVVVAELEGATQALRLVDELQLAEYHPFHAVRADLLRRVGRLPEAAAAYGAALARCGNLPERRFLEEQLRATASTT